MSTQHLHRRVGKIKGPLHIRYEGKIAFVTLVDGNVAIVDAENAERVAAGTWSTRTANGRIAQVFYTKHSQIMTLTRFITGCGSDERVYVNNGDLLDNRMENFTVVKWGGDHVKYRRGGGGNYHRKPVEAGDVSEFKGVKYVGGSRNPYQAYVEIDGALKVVGNYLTAEAAAAARDCAAFSYYGEDFADSNL